MTRKDSGETLRRLAEERKLSAYAIARALGVSHTTAYGWLEGKFKPGREHLPGLARLLEVSMGQISEEGAALAAEHGRLVAEAVLRIVEGVAAGQAVAAATDTELGEPAPFFPEEAALVGQVTAQQLLDYLDAQAGEPFRQLPRDRKIALLQGLLSQDADPGSSTPD